MRYESTHRAIYLKALFTSQLRYTAALWRCYEYVVLSGDVELMGKCRELLGEIKNPAG